MPVVLFDHADGRTAKARHIERGHTVGNRLRDEACLSARREIGLYLDQMARSIQ